MYAICRSVYGINIVLSKYDTIQPSPTGEGEFITGDVPDNNGGNNGIYTGSPHNASVDGTIERNYKSDVILKINVTTNNLIRKGIDHRGHVFEISVETQLNAFGRMFQRVLGQDLTGATFRSVGKTYTFVNNDDFDEWFFKALGRVDKIISDGSALKDAVTSSENTEAAMASIIGADNARS